MDVMKQNGYSTAASTEAVARQVCESKTQQMETSSLEVEGV